MIRLAHTFTLHPGMEEEYERRHKPIWPELAAKLKEHGAHNYSIFRHGLTLIAYVEVEDQERWNALAETEVVRRWWAHMAPVMQSNPDNSPQATDYAEVFHLD